VGVKAPLCRVMIYSVTPAGRDPHLSSPFQGEEEPAGDTELSVKEVANPIAAGFSQPFASPY
jgi:hypothetical protein